MAKEILVFEYSKCSTCRKALKFLADHKLVYQKKDIVTTPPTLKQIELMLAQLLKKGKTLKHLFNTSGESYRALGLSEKLPKLSQTEALALLVKDGKLIKRPFLLSDTCALVGFQEDEWKDELLTRQSQ